MSTLEKVKNLIFTKRFALNIMAIVASLLVFVFLLKFYLGVSTAHGEKIEVPNLIGKNEKDLVNILGQIDLEYEVSETVYAPEKPEGTIISQDPLPSKETNVFIKKGRAIRVKISKKSQLIDLPVLVDKSERFAVNVLNSRGFKYRIEYKPSVESAGAVIEQLYSGKKVIEGQKIPIGSMITLIVGKRADAIDIELPDLVGRSICDAKSRLSGSAYINLVVICDNCATASDSCNAIVNLQSPEYLEGKYVSGSSTITIHASK